MVFLGVVTVSVRSPPVSAYTPFHTCFCVGRRKTHTRTKQAHQLSLYEKGGQKW